MRDASFPSPRNRRCSSHPPATTGGPPGARIIHQRGRWDRRNPLDGIPLRPGAEAAVEVEHPAAPGRHRIVRGEELEVADAARPLEAAEDDVVGVERRGPAEVRLRREGEAQWPEALAEGRQPRLAVGDKGLERHAEALLAALAE